MIAMNMKRDRDQYHPSSSSHGQAYARIERFISNDGTIRASSVVCTDVIEEARKIHDTFPVATAALGRALVGVGLLASFLKDKEKLSLHFKGDGPLGQVFAEGTEEGFVRGFVVNPHAHIPSVEGKLAVGPAVGRGVLNVAHSAPYEKSPYTGTVAIQTGEIAEDLAYYLFQSMQIPSVVALGVFVEPDNSVSAAGGMIVQLMPGATEKTIETLEKSVQNMRPVTEMIQAGAGPQDMVMELLEDFTTRQFGVDKYLSYSCHCTKARVIAAVSLLGRQEVETMVKNKETQEVRCDFCGRKYVVSTQDLQELLQKAK